MAYNFLHQRLPRTGTATGKKEAITLPSRDSAIRHAHEAIEEAPDLRKELVAQLRQALAVENLVLDSQSLADKLIGIQLHDVRSAA